jgi:2-oxoglutarate dehydrogenase E2 component (dihydrolipoamide succinyltransferase)
VSVVTAARHRHSPRVRRLAAEVGVGLSSVDGTGPGGRVTTADVRRAKVAADDASALPTGSGTAQPATAALTSVVEVDVSAIVGHDQGDLPLAAYVAKATVEALRQHPRLNTPVGTDGSTDATVHLGLAVDSGRGTVVSVVPDAGDLNLQGLARRLAELVDRAHTGSSRTDDLPGGTFTLADAGSHGALWDTPPLAPGQAAALGLGSVVERPVVVRRPDGERVVAIRSMAYLVLARDPQLADAAESGRFLKSVKDRLEAGRSHGDRA